MKIFVSVLMVLFCSLLYSQTGISGIVIDGEFDDLLPFANVVVIETGDGTTTDFDGKYFLELTQGSYTIEISFVGYDKKRITGVNVSEGKITSLDVVLDASSNALEEVVVTTTAKRNSETAVLNIQKNANVVLDGLSIQAIKKAGDSDIASAVKRVPGVSVQGGKFVFVRGLGDRYSKTMLNSLELPGIDPDKNTLPLDIFPTSIIENILVQKSASSKLAADFTGGVVNIELKKFTFTPEYNFSYSAGFNPEMHFNNSFIRDQRSGTDWRGVDKDYRTLPLDATVNLPPALSFLPGTEILTKSTRSLSKRMVPLNDTSDMNHSFNFSASSSIDLGGEAKLGYIASVGYKTEQQFYENYIDNTVQKNEGALEFYSEQNSKLGVINKYLSGLAGLTFQNNQNKISLNVLRLQNSESKATNLDRTESVENNYLGVGSTLSYTEKSMLSIPLQWKYKSEDDVFEFNWAYSYSRSSLRDKDLRRSVFETNTSRDVFYFSPNQVSAPSRIWRNLDEESEVLSVDIKVDFDGLGETSSISFGKTINSKIRNFDSKKFDVWYLGDSTILEGNSNAYFFEENIWTRDKRIGTYLRGGFERTNIYESEIDIDASYFETELNFTKEFKLVLGIRNEIFDLKYTGEDLPGNKYEKTPFIGTQDNFLFGNMIYAINNKLKFRLSYYETTARPSFREASTAYIYDPVSETFFLGNPEVQPSYIDNYDLRLEKFSEKNEMFAISFFYKDFYNPIEITNASQNSPNTFLARNIGGATVKGFELEIRENIIDTDNTLTSFSSNVTLIDAEQTMSIDEYDSKYEASKDELVDKVLSNKRPLQGQSPYIINASLNTKLINYDFEFGVFYNVQGETLTNVGLGGIPDVYTKPFNKLDLNIKKSFSGDLDSSLQLRVSNILDEKVESLYKWLGEDSFIFNSFNPGITFTLGYRIKF